MMRAEKLRRRIYANIQCLRKYGVKDADQLEELVEKDKNGDLLHLTPLRAIYKLIQRTKYENDRPQQISLDSDEDDFSDGDYDSDHDVTVTEIKTEKNEDEKVSAVSVLIQQSKLWQSQNRTEKTNEKRSDSSTSKDGFTHRDSMHPPLQELSTNVKFSASDGSSSSHSAVSALQRSVAFRGDRQSQSIALQNSDGGDDFSSCDEGISSVSTVDFEEQHAELELTPPARIFEPKSQGIPAHLNGNVPSQSTSAAVFTGKLEPITKTAEERVPHPLPYQTNTSNNGMNNSSVARKTSPIIPLIPPAASSRAYQCNSAKFSGGKTSASTSVLQHRYQETVSHWHDPNSENQSWTDHSTAPGPYGSYSTFNSSRNAAIATSIPNPSMHRQERITTLIQPTNHRKSHQQTTHGFSGSSNRTRDVSAAAPLTTKPAIIQKLTASEYNPTEHAMAPKSKITQRTNNAIRQLVNQKQPTAATANKLTEFTSNGIAKQSDALDSLKRSQLVEYDSSSGSSSSPRSSHGSKSRDVNDEKHKPRTTTSVSQKDNRSKRFDAKPSTSQRNDVKPSKSKRDDDGPSTSKRYSNESAHSSEFESERSLLLKAINERCKIPMPELNKIAEDVKKNKSKSVELATQMNPMPVVPSTSHNISQSKEKLNRKRYHDPTTKQILLSRELDDLNDPGSMYYVKDLPPKRRRKSTHRCFSLDDDQDDSEPSYRPPSSSASAANSIRNRSFENDDSRHSNTSYSTHAMEVDPQNLLTPLVHRGENSAGKNLNPCIYFEEPMWRAHCVVCGKGSSDKCITAHYVHSHPGLEVYTSRFSSGYAKRARDEPSMPRLENTTKGAKMRAPCYFCAKEMVFDPKYWPQHLLSHTGEYANECLICKRKISNEANHRRRFPDHEIVKRIDYTFDENYLWAYMCNSCNYVQTQEVNMEKHLRNEHGFPHQDQREYYCRIRLLSNRMCEPMANVKEEISDEKLERDYGEDSDQFEYYDTDPEDGPEDEPPTTARTISQSVLEPIITLNIKNEHTRCVDEEVNIGYAQLNEPNDELPNPICDGLAEEPNAIQTSEQDAAGAHILNPVEMQDTTTIGAPGPSTVEIRRFKKERMDGELETVQTAADRSRDINHLIDKMNDKNICLYLSLEHCYMKNDPKMIVKLTPWLGDDILGDEKQLRPVTLYALYKCMAENCIFSTNDEKAMDHHLKEHEILVALLLRRDANRDLSARQRSGWLKCAYCVHEAKSSIEIIRHTKMEHGNCAFQCSLCFYRTIEIANMDSHIVKCHPVDDTAQILVCKRELKSLDNERMEMVQNRKIYLPPYVVRTDEGTEENFYVKEDFEERLDATTVPYYDCSKCEFSGFRISKSNALQHLICHGLHMYHCLHCHYGATLSHVLDHMHENHPSKLLYLSSRKFHKTPLRKDDVEATVIVDMGNSKEEMLKKWRITVCPYSETQLNFMGPALRSIVSNQKDPPGQGQFVNINVEDISRAYRLKESQGAFLTQDDFDKLIEAEK